MFAKIENQTVVEYPIMSITQRFPHVSFPSYPVDSDLPKGYVRVYTAQPPVLDEYSKAIPSYPTLVVDRWVQGWTVAPLSAEELAAKRDALKASVVSATQARLDAFARTRGYDGILSACTYATSSVDQFRVEGSYCVASRDATWGKLHEIMSEVESGTRPFPSGFMDIEAALPVLTWPE